MAEQQIDIPRTTTLPPKAQLLPSIASLVKAQKTIPEMVEILGCDEEEVKRRLEAAGLMQWVAQLGSAPAPAAPAAALPAATQTAQAPEEKKAEPAAAPAPARRARTAPAAAAPVPAQSPLATPATTPVMASSFTASVVQPGAPQSDATALAVGHLTILALRTGTPLETILAWAKVALSVYGQGG